MIEIAANIISTTYQVFRWFNLWWVLSWPNREWDVSAAWTACAAWSVSRQKQRKAVMGYKVPSVPRTLIMATVDVVVWVDMVSICGSCDIFRKFCGLPHRSSVTCILPFLLIDGCGDYVDRCTEVQLRSFYEDQTGHMLAVERGSLSTPACLLAGTPRTGCWYHVLKISSSSCAKWECQVIIPSKRLGGFFFFWTGQAEWVWCWHWSWIFPGSEEHLEV